MLAYLKDKLFKEKGVITTPTYIDVGSQNERGFTLIETLVAISILLMAVVAPMTLIAGNISAIFNAKDKVTALYLAEDAIDFVKYKIATRLNAGDGANWLGDIPGSAGSLLYLDSFNDTIMECSGTCPKLSFDSANGIYGHVSGATSKFTRKVSIENVGAPADPNPTTPGSEEIIITARVEWDYKGALKWVEISTHAFSWGT